MKIEEIKGNPANSLPDAGQPKNVNILQVIGAIADAGKEPSQRHKQLLLSAIKGNRICDVSTYENIEELLDIDGLPSAEFSRGELDSNDLVFLPDGELIAVGDVCDQEKIGSWKFWCEYIAPLDDALA